MRSISTDKSHYQKFEPPFLIPDSWEWATVRDVSSSILYGVSESAKPNGKYKLLRITDIQDNDVIWNNVPFTNFDTNKAELYILQNGDILFARTGATVGKSYLVKDVPLNSIYASYLIRIRTSDEICPKYLKLFFESGYYWQQISEGSVGIGQPNVNGTSLGQLLIPIPPKTEQIRIIEEVDSLTKLIHSLDIWAVNLSNTIERTKKKILDLAMEGKLVPQDPTDEPAADMLLRINPKAKIITDNPHYPQLPDNWVLVPLEDITEYEQPQPYIVQDTSYSDMYTIPVLTAGKSFILGYTNEDFGIYENVPTIIFDDFTTDSRLVEFPFKVKSSAMKIIQVKRGLNIEYVALFMSITRLIGETHKRYWISEYSKIAFPFPPLDEQKRIVKKVKALYCELDKITSDLTE